MNTQKKKPVGFASRPRLPFDSTAVSLGSATHIPRRWAYAFVVSIPAIYALILLAFWNRVGPRDYDQFLVFHKLQYWNANLFGLAKQWAPVMCSGLSLAGEPQVPFASLTMALGYLLGPQAGLALGVAAYFIAGWVGTYLYSGLYLKESLQRALAASLFIGNGFFICRMAYGHVDFLPFLSLPLALWIVHRTVRPAPSDPPAIQSFAAIGALGVLISMAIDGSPVAILHWLTWIVLYCLALSVVTRSFRPLFVIGSACLLACCLDAGYLWPMVEAQALFPRLTPDTFTGPWNLLWFLLIPMRGKIFPANGKGLELSVFIGPIFCYLIWRYRKILAAQIPSAVRTPLIAVSLFSILMGMGSLHAVDVPVWLSPFDWLRPLPGFRSLGVTGRYWGFLALPLSLLSAAAIWHWLFNETRGKRWAGVLLLGLSLQLIFQTQSLLSQWTPSRSYPVMSGGRAFDGGSQSVRAIQFEDDDKRRQGEYISPTQQVINCYDQDDFLRANIQPGSTLVQDVHTRFSKIADQRAAAEFVSWNHIRVTGIGPKSNGAVQVTLNQAYNSFWRAEGCEVQRGPQNNLVLSCPSERLNDSAINLVFYNGISASAARISQVSWAFAASFAIFGFAYAGYRSRVRRVGEPSLLGARQSGFAERQ
jgi:hypothetical protein